ncbi:hypothetical protein V6Z12_D01G047600 [Gossypium hirsutum]
MLQYQQSLRSLSSFSISGCPLLTDSVVHLEAEKASIKGVRLSAFKDSFKTSKRLELDSIRDHNLVPEANEDGLNGVTSLQLEKCKDLECLVDTTATATKNGPTSAFSHLETLFIEDMDGLEALCKGQPPQGFLKNLKHLEVRECCKLQVVGELLHDGEQNQEHPLSNLQSLKLYQLPALRWIFKGSPLVDTTATATKNGPTSAFSHLETLFIEDMDGLEALCKGQPPQGFLKNLKHLEVRECCKLQVVGELLHDGEQNQEHPLSNLQSLKLYQLPALRWIFKGSPHSFTLQILKVVYINGCGKLKSLLSPSLIQSLVLLEQFEIQHCNELETLFADPEIDGEIESKPSSLPLCLPKLNTLSIKGCAKLEYVVPKPSSLPLRLPKLNTLSIKECAKLEYVVPITLAQGLPALESLTVSWCDELKQVFGMPNEQDGVQHHGSLPKLNTLSIKRCAKLEYVVPITLAQGLPALESLTVSWCDELKQVFGMPNEQDGVQHHGSLPKLNTLSIKRSAKLEYVVPITLAQGLPALESLTVSWCDELKQVFGMPNEQDGVQHHGSLLLRRLQCLKLKGLRNFTSFVPQNYIVKAPSLKRLGANDCPKVINIPIQQANNQLELTIEKTGLSVFKELLCNTNDLILYNIGDHKNLVPDLIDLEHLDGLTSLCIDGWQDGECLVDISQAMMDFKYNDQSPKCFLQNLKILRVSDCKDLSKIFRMDDGIESNAYYLSNLEILEIESCCSLEYVFPHASVGVFSYLREVELFGLRNLRSIVGGNNSLEAPILEILCISQSSVFTNFTFPKEVKKCGSLKKLYFSMEDIDSEDVNLCDMVNTQLRQKSPDFEYITLGNFEQLFQLQGGNIISSLEKMELFNVIRLRDIWKGPIQVATNLRKIRVHCCNNLTYIFPETLIPHLPQLSILDIASCENLKQIIGNDDILESSSSSQGPQLEMKMVFPQLKKIELENLSKLESFSPMGYHLEFPCLHSLDIKECSKMITSFSADYLTLTVHAKTDQFDAFATLKSILKHPLVNFCCNE